MHPAYSVIFFTTASGAGYGLLIWLAFAALLELTPPEFGSGVAGFGLSFALITAGLFSSMTHLGRPERAWRAFSQWRTSWLSREGVMAVITYVPAGILAIGWVFLEEASGIFAVAAVLTIIAALVTVYCTGMIYASLPTIRQWHQPLTTPIYLALSLASGAVLLCLLLSIFDPEETGGVLLALPAIAVAAAFKWLYWRGIDEAPRDFTPEAATGLGRIGKVRPLEPPHTQPNFVMREMGYQVARKHALKLRNWVYVLVFAAPALLVLTSYEEHTITGIIGCSLATLAMGAGLVVERWLFFAEAEHVVMLYYGAESA